MIHRDRTENTIVNFNGGNSTFWKKSDNCDVVEVHAYSGVIPGDVTTQDHLELRFHSINDLEETIKTLIHARDGFKRKKKAA